jgi:hypothetical protein
MKRYSRIRRLMKKWVYLPITEPLAHIDREIKLSKILDQKLKTKWNTFYSCKNDSIEYAERMEVFNWFRKLGKTEEEIRDIWWETRHEKTQTNYDKMPPKERKDNGHPELDGINHNGGGSNSNKIRVPSKKRKNKWKRFRKLFPEYCERRGI